ncbi:hypothetical protein Syun_000453 [Stephania yunnanensis]|uniref:Protein kinase domain-containing protein n=1 Tax=Stephania yunnanensis TaxID=152371 RepID=A0AAP0LC17_9MAGN
MAMAQSGSRARVVGDYVIGQQIGSGSFSVVWHARHRDNGMEFAIKEIAMARLSPKLQESLMSEIEILRRISHPNIIRLHDIIQAPGRIHLVLDYCRGGDLSVYIRQHGRVSEAIAKHFMCQLAAGLQVLRENNLIHRDLKPQNLLLLTKENNPLLKIADFGFARSLQPKGLAETLCGSPLYMAPEIMQLQKYDAKADLWSVGTILYQLVTGNTPFTGNSQIQLLQNIMKSNELRFPPDCKNLNVDCIDLCQKLLRRNPVGRITFEEFFNHPFFSRSQSLEPLSWVASRAVEGFQSAASSPGRRLREASQDDHLPSLLDDTNSDPHRSQSLPVKWGSAKSSGFFHNKVVDAKPEESNFSGKMNLVSRCSKEKHEVECNLELDSHRSSDLKKPVFSLDQITAQSSSPVVDSLEFIDQDYVLVSGPPLDVSSSSVGESRQQHVPFKPDSSSLIKNRAVSAPVPIIGATVSNVYGFGSLESHSSAPSGTSQGSVDIGDAIEQPSSHFTRIRSLQQFACAIKELVTEKVSSDRKLEAFSIQLVILAIWKQAVDICHTLAASASDGVSALETNCARGSIDKKQINSSIQECHNVVDAQGPEALCSQIEREFLLEVGNAEELAGCLEPIDGGTAMPDAMETIFQAALGLGRHGAVKEMVGDMETSAGLYSKAVCLLLFLLVEAHSLIINPPFSLTSSDRYRLRTYIDILNNRQSQTKSQRMALLKCEDQLCTP